MAASGAGEKDGKDTPVTSMEKDERHSIQFMVLYRKHG